MTRIKGLAYHPALLTALSPLLAAPFAASAQIQTLTTCAGIVTFIEKIAGYFSAIIFAIALIILLYAGFLFLTGGGNEETTKKAKSYLIFSLIGLAVALLAFVLPQAVETILGGGRGGNC